MRVTAEYREAERKANAAARRHLAKLLRAVRGTPLAAPAEQRPHVMADVIRWPGRGSGPAQPPRMLPFDECGERKRFRQANQPETILDLHAEWEREQKEKHA